jgi:predicted nucleic acid-binding protein
VILVDTSVWVDHLRRSDELLADLLDHGNVLAHPFVIGELALGNLPKRGLILDALSDLPRATVATDDEVLHFTERNTLFGLGVGYIDAHLLAAVTLTAGSTLWTRDKRLHAVAEPLGLTTPQFER